MGPSLILRQGDHASGGRGIDLNGKYEEFGEFTVAPHPAFSHLLPKGEDKETEQIFSCQVIHFHQ